MRARALSPRGSARRPHAYRRPSAAALVFLRGRDADGRLREQVAVRTAGRPVIGALAVEMVGRRLFEPLGFRSLGDYARERMGVGARTMREWARVWKRLGELPHLRRAVVSGEVSWTVARLVVGIATPGTDEACVETVRGRTVRGVKEILVAVRRATRSASGLGPLDHGDAPGNREQAAVRLHCTPREVGLWQVAVELARRAAGEALPVWQCAELIAAEAASALGGSEAEWKMPLASGTGTNRSTRRQSASVPEPAFRARAHPGLRWEPPRSAAPQPWVALAANVESCGAIEIDRRLRAVVAFLQEADFEIGRILRQMIDRRLFAEIGFEGLEHYAIERLDLSGRTARRLAALARAEHRAPAVAAAYREGRLHAFQARVLNQVANPANARAWVERALRVTLRRLEDDLEAEVPAALAFHAPPDVASFFLAMLARVGSLERLLAHAITTWIETGSRFVDYADFRRDGYRCTVPGCTARRNLQSHHIRFRSAGGPDVAWNRTTLCAFHHHRGVHAGRVRIRGRAPDRMVYELGVGRFASGDVKL